MERLLGRRNGLAGNFGGVVRVKVPKHVADKLVGITKKDVRVEFFRASGKGGQHRNKTDTACRMTHLATGISAEATDSRSQADNKQGAWFKLVNRLIAYYKAQMVQEERRTNKGWAEKIRTYHEPRGIVKDHRTGITQNYQRTLDGDLDQFIEGMYL
jgi:protein subunit release factor A